MGFEGGEARAGLLEAIERIAPVLEEENAEAEAIGAPTARMGDAMREAGLIGIKAPREAGGLEADWTLQTEVLHRVAYSSFSAAWCLMLYIDNTGKAAAFLPESGLARITKDGRLATLCGGGGLRIGALSPCEGGYRLSGDWVFGSGLAQSDFVMVGARLQSDDPAPDIIQCVVPTSQVTPANNWQVMGLRGSGSGDFGVRDVFLPADMTFGRAAKPARGGAMYRLGTFGYAGLCMPAVMIGAARRALDELAASAASKDRGYMHRTTLARRGAFQNFLGKADLELKAALALSIGMGEKLLRDAARLGESPPANEAEARAVGVHCSRVAVETINGVVAYAGGSGVRAGHLFERTLRDMHMANTHAFVSDIALENHAHFLMNLPDAALQA